jgi:hypothetical protein
MINEFLGKEQFEQLEEVKKDWAQWKSFMVPMGISVISNDGKFKTTIVGVNEGVVDLRTEYNGSKKISLELLFDSFLIETPQGIGICGYPVNMPMMQPPPEKTNKESKLILPGEFKLN